MRNQPKYLDQFYFAYGSNLHLEQMFRRCPDAVQLVDAVLHDHRLTFRGNYRGTGVADVVPSKGDQVRGGLYLVSERDLQALDRYEGYPTLYDRHTITVETDQGTVQAFAYRMLDHFRPAVPADFYFEVIFEGYRNWKLPTKLLMESLGAVSSEVMNRDKKVPK